VIDAATADAARTAGVAFAVAVVVTGAVLWIARRRNLLDVPNERSSHTVPTPRSGGLGIVAGFVVLLLSSESESRLFVMGGMALVMAAGVGLRDDRRPLGPGAKGAGLILVSLFAYMAARVVIARDVPFAGDVALGFLGMVLTPFWFAGYANAFNFMDGLDGFATLTAIVSASVFAIAGLATTDATLTLFASATLGGSLGFLPWNFPKARIFMGDAGSLPLGMALALCAVMANATGALPFPASILLLGPFLFDVTFTLARRWRRRERLGEAHKEHLYQRLSRVWDSHAKVSLLYAGFSVATGVLALQYASMSDLGKLLSLAVPLAAMLGFAAFVLRAEREKGR